MRWENPEVFYLFIVLILLWSCTLYYMKRKEKDWITKIGEKTYSFLSASLSKQKRVTKRILEFLTFVFFILALARLQVGEGFEKIKSKGLEMVLILDISQSMLAEDVKPDRLSHLKREIHKLIDLSSSDKIGLLAFAGSAIVVSPMTTDLSALKMYLHSLTPELIMNQGTNIEKALNEAHDLFLRGGVDLSEGNVNVSRVIVIATDGEDHDSAALKMAEKIANKGVKIFVMGFGTEQGAPIPIKDDHEYTVGYKKDLSGKIITTRMDSSFLKKLSDAGNGVFFEIPIGGEQVNLLRKEVEGLIKNENEMEIATIYNEKFQWFLFFALLCGVTSLVLGERRDFSKIWLGRFEVVDS